KLGGALLLIVLVSVGIMAYLTNQKTTTEFQRYVEAGGMMYARNVADSLTQFYAGKRSWSGVQEYLSGIPRSPSERLIVADSAGAIVGDTSALWLGRTAKDVQLSGGTNITVSGRSAGTLYVLISGGRMGMGMGRGPTMGMGMAGTDITLEAAQSDFLSRTNNYLWIAGLIALAFALVLGVLLTRQIIRPVRALTAGARHIARGDLGHRVKVSSRDELGELAQSFNAMASSLDRGEQARKRLVSDVAHELRTPLTIIEGTVDAIMDGVFQPDPERLGTIKEQTAVLTRLVSDLRDLSLAESGQMKLELAPSDMVELARRKLAQFEVAAKDKGITLMFDATPELPKVMVDSFRMEQVLANLMTNAIRHTPPAGNIEVKVNKDEAGKNLLISVADTGEGIPPEHLNQVFERFYRVEDSRARSEGGAGLGLAIVRQMVEAHSGRVWVESQVGKGSTFYISLPLHKNKQ
ncbi:MAG: ATP-binding protein, partial [Dehalococcoidia bacterium]|nr:ATP-binding protein [Dehalococcoidia bacterium]